MNIQIRGYPLRNLQASWTFFSVLRSTTWRCTARQTSQRILGFRPWPINFHSCKKWILSPRSNDFATSSPAWIPSGIWHANSEMFGLPTSDQHIGFTWPMIRELLLVDAIAYPQTLLIVIFYWLRPSGTHHLDFGWGWYGRDLEPDEHLLVTLLLSLTNHESRQRLMMPFQWKMWIIAGSQQYVKTGWKLATIWVTDPYTVIMSLGGSGFLKHQSSTFTFGLNFEAIQSSGNHLHQSQKA
jgi:hypothetical protein